MASACVSVLFVLSCLLLLLLFAKADPSCESFLCKNLGMIGFPFSNPPNPECGLFTVDCDKQEIILDRKAGNKYPISSISQSNTINITDPILAQHLQQKSCESFKNLSFPPSSFFSFAIATPNISLFKCSPKIYLASASNHSCGSFNVYYNLTPPYERFGLEQSIPPHCSIIQLPVNMEALNRPVSMDVFSILVASFSLEVQVSRYCYECHQKGGFCFEIKDYEPKFECRNAEIGNTGLGLQLGLSISAAAVGFIIVFTLICSVISRCILVSTPIFKKGAKNDKQIDVFIRNFGSDTPKRYSYWDIKKITNSFRHKLGQGGFGCVYKGKLCNGRIVAVKVLNQTKDSGEEFINEVASISKTSHVNVVNLLGFCYEKTKRALIYEFMLNGSLDRFIYDKGFLDSKPQLELKTLYEITVGVARGLEYLHRGCNTRILHFDIKPHNILLDEDFCPKISDFGLAKLCQRKESIISMLGTRGTVGYIAPEVFSRLFGGVSYKSDVYSYGMMILEIVMGRETIEAGSSQSSELYFPNWIYKHLEPGAKLRLHRTRTEEEEELARKMILVGLWCIQTIPSDRPSMTKVVEMLEGSTHSLQIPPKPILSSPPMPQHHSCTISLLSSSLN